MRGTRRILTLGVVAAWAQSASAGVIEIRDGRVVERVGAGAVAWSDDATTADPLADFVEFDAAAITPLAETRAPPAYRALVEEVAAAYHVSPTLLEALVWQESRWRADAVSPKGARGLAQLMPGTARDLGVDAADPRANLIGGARYLRQMLDMFDGDVERALAAYNAGPGRVRRARGIPAITETRNYVVSIMDRVSGPATVSGASR